jgi:hypothetical protein
LSNPFIGLSYYRKLVDLGGYPGDREKGLLRLEGKEYIVNNGEVYP